MIEHDPNVVTWVRTQMCAARGRPTVQHGHLPEVGVKNGRCPVLPAVLPLTGIARTRSRVGVRPTRLSSAVHRPATPKTQLLRIALPIGALNLPSASGVSPIGVPLLPPRFAVSVQEQLCGPPDSVIVCLTILGSMGVLLLLPPPFHTWWASSLQGTHW